MIRKGFSALVLGVLALTGAATAEGPFYHEPEHIGPKFTLTRRNVTILHDDSGYTARVTMKNRGEKRAKDVHFTCWLEREGDKMKAKEVDIERIPAGKSHSVDCPLGKLGPGDYYFKARETWGKESEFATYSFHLPGPNVKVLPSHLWIVPNTPWPGQGYAARMGVLNVGEKDADKVNISVSVWTLDEKPVGAPYYFTLGAVKAGEEVSKLVEMPGLPTGHYRLVVRVDADSSIAEVKEKDNRTEVPLNVWKPLSSFAVHHKAVITP